MTEDWATESQHRYDAVVGSSKEWIWALDEAGMVVDCNATVEDILGYSSEEIIGREISRFAHPADLESLRGEFSDRPLEEVLTAPRRARWIHKDGSYRYLETTLTPRFDDDLFRGAIATSRDVTGEVRQQLDEEEQRVMRDAVTTRIRDAIVSDSVLSIHFQPIVSIAGARPVGFEALARFAAGASRSPDAWFAEAKDVGLATDLELAAMQRALAQLDALPEEAYVSVNVSPDVVMSHEFLGFILDAVVPLERVVVEITEHATVSDYDHLSSTLSKLRRLGIRIAIDDAGAGYSSLRHIVRLGPEIIKLDRGLVANIHQDPVKRALAAGMVAFCTGTGATLIAEAVELEEERRVLEMTGVPLAQGYLFGRPQAM